MAGSEACLTGSEVWLAASKPCLAGSWTLEEDKQTNGRKISLFNRTLSPIAQKGRGDCHCLPSVCLSLRLLRTPSPQGSLAFPLPYFSGGARGSPLLALCLPFPLETTLALPLTFGRTRGLWQPGCHNAPFPGFCMWETPGEQHHSPSSCPSFWKRPESYHPPCSSLPEAPEAWHQ